MNKREKIFVYTGAAVVATFLIFTFALRPLLQNGGESAMHRQSVQTKFFDLRSEMDQTLANRREIAKLEKSLGVKVSSKEPSLQLKSFVEMVEKLGKKCSVKIKHITPRNQSAKRSRKALQAQDQVSLSIAFECSHEGLVKFVGALQESKWPVVFRDIDIKCTPKSPDKLSANMQFYTYIFDGQEG
jgi:TFIIF-interacting CTD phosphatase-like protein